MPENSLRKNLKRVGSSSNEDYYGRRSPKKLRSDTLDSGLTRFELGELQPSSDQCVRSRSEMETTQCSGKAVKKDLCPGRVKEIIAGEVYYFPKVTIPSHLFLLTDSARTCLILANPVHL